MKRIKIKLNIDLLKYKKGNVISIVCDESGTPIDQFWRKRLRDSVKDNCVTIIEDKKKKSSK